MAPLTNDHQHGSRETTRTFPFTVLEAGRPKRQSPCGGAARPLEEDPLFASSPQEEVPHSCLLVATSVPALPSWPQCLLGFCVSNLPLKLPPAVSLL